jgi:SAM-dependent methyltransferase
MTDFSREDFIKFWGEEGYQEGFGNKYPFDKDLERILEANIPTVLDVGCGNGFWTMHFLRKRFARIIAVDVIDRPKIFDGTDVIYQQAGSMDYSLSTVPDNSIDLIWCFGVLCHLSQSATAQYLKSFYRVMKPGAKALIMFAEWTRGQYCGTPNPKQYIETPLGGWYYYDTAAAERLLIGAGFDNMKEILPDFRDLLVETVKHGTV